MTKTVALGLAAVLAVAPEAQLAALAPGTYTRIQTRAVEQLTLPAVSVRFHLEDMESGLTGRGVDVRGGTATSAGKYLWRIQPHDGGRPILYPIGATRVDGELVAIEEGLVVLRVGAKKEEIVFPLDGVASVARSKAPSHDDKILAGAAGVVVLGILAALALAPGDKEVIPVFSR